ncbi:MAG: hypothetical protein ACKVQU_34100 [Burkholderiales bacterium]
MYETNSPSTSELPCLDLRAIKNSLLPGNEFEFPTYGELREYHRMYLPNAVRGRAVFDGKTLFLSVEYGMVSDTVDLVTTPCRFGGSRYWIQCVHCTRRVVAAYLVSDENGHRRFRCRHCARLGFATQSVTANRRALLKMMKIRAKLSAPVNFLEPVTARPRYMHTTTYAGLMAAAQAIEEVATHEFVRITDAVAFAAGYIRKGNKLIRPRARSTRC